MVFLVSEVSVLAKNLTTFLIVASLMDGNILIASNDAIFTSYLFIFNYSSLSFRLDAWTMETRELFTFPLSKDLLISRYLIL